jgi:hypothetical protein
MNKLRELLYIARHLNRRKADHDLDAEIRSHLDHETQDKLKGASGRHSRIWQRCAG